jgi:hypothetical protein
LPENPVKIFRDKSAVMRTEIPSLLKEFPDDRVGRTAGRNDEVKKFCDVTKK